MRLKTIFIIFILLILLETAVFAKTGKVINTTQRFNFTKRSFKNCRSNYYSTKQYRSWNNRKKWRMV